MRVTVIGIYEELFGLDPMEVARGDLAECRRGLAAHLADTCTATYAQDVMSWFDKTAQSVKPKDSVFHGMTTSWEYKKANGTGHDMWILSY